jgi:hypothetical protein
MNEHPDPHKMRPAELQACGCARCNDTLRTLALLDQLIASQQRTSEALDRIEHRITNVLNQAGA